MLRQILAESLTHDGRIAEHFGNVRLEKNHIRSFPRTLVILPADTAGEVRFRDVVFFELVRSVAHIVAVLAGLLHGQ